MMGKLKTAVKALREKKQTARRPNLQRQVSNFVQSQAVRKQRPIAPTASSKRRRAKPWIYGGVAATSLVGGGYLYKRRKK